MKKVIAIIVIIILVVGIAGAFSVNYIFDKMIGNQILSGLDLELVTDEVTDYSIADNDLENEDKDIGKESHEKNNTSEGKKEGYAEDKNSSKSNEFTAGQLKEIEDHFSTMDKLKVTSMLTSKLSMDEIKELVSLASGGVNKEELSRIKKDLKEKLSPDDVKYLKDLYEKYN
ncbi:hypothetical protein [Alkaliphilus sp. B6464]|uniref:hypothetical protein n=1 Tax=Alkaliphilus sp. B6464 TaxID=2731219 RepID=UPI001BA44D58|nr:hypothetical protein [Alkaliphilus sp. B6464]QUH19062.1 hypothetical protein HYG84_03625 [Alkaliphilus sp. B6464]